MKTFAKKRPGIVPFLAACRWCGYTTDGGIMSNLEFASTKKGLKRKLRKTREEMRLPYVEID